MTLYKYLPGEFGLQALQQRRLKVSRLTLLNDIHDCVPLINGEGRLSETSPLLTPETLQSEINQQFGIISYSATAENQLVWAHYGDSHKGIALGFGEFHNQLTPPVCVRVPAPVRYPKDKGDNARATISIPEILESARKDKSPPAYQALSAGYLNKGFEWTYEQEYREFVELALCPIVNQLYFMPFDATHLKEVVIGARCSIDAAMIKHSHMHSGWSDLVIRKAKPHESQYRMEIIELDRIVVG